MICTFCDAPAVGTNTLPDGDDPVPACEAHRTLLVALGAGLDPETGELKGGA